MFEILTQHMVDFAEAIPFSFAALVPVLNPLGGAITFLTITMGMSEKDVASLARKVAANIFVLLTIVLISGSWILQFFGISIPAVQVAGGLVVSYIAWGMLHQLPNSIVNSLVTVKGDKDPSELAFFPLTMPMTAGPGSIAVTLTIGAHHMERSPITTMVGELGSIVGIFLGAAVVWICYQNAYRITLAIGKNGTQAIRRIFAFINLCIGIQILWHGISALLSLQGVGVIH